jgi:cytochrome c oxidase subunit 2
MHRRLSFIFAILAVIWLPALALARVPDPARGWENHFNLWAILSVIIWLIVTISLIYMIIKYRRKKPDEEGADIHGNTLLEVTWTAVPLVIIILLGVQSWALYNEYRTVPKDAYEIKVEGYQYGYDVKYAEGFKKINELRVPVGPVKVLLSSRDVIHTFSVPKFRVKEDMIPGRTTYMWFRANKPGVYRVFCSELCGPGHSLMLAKVVVMEKDAFNAWIEENRTATMEPAERGRQLVEGMCMGCHGKGGFAPALKGVYSSKGKAYIKDIVKNGKAPMPGFASLSDSEISTIIEYLKTLD